MRILIIEDNKRLAKNLSDFLKLEGYAIEICENGDDGFKKANFNEYDCLILDINLPGMDGLHVCQNLRGKKNMTPILMLTSMSSIDDKITGLDCGADDYMTKPFSLEELSARIKALIRRASTISSSVLKIDSIDIDLNNRTVKKDGKGISLSPKEYAVLEYLLFNRGETVNRTQILDHVWGDKGEELDFASDTVEVHISYLRNKIGKDIIKTRRGFGYLIE